MKLLSIVIANIRYTVNVEILAQYIILRISSRL